MSHCWTPSFIIIFITASLSSDTYNIATDGKSDIRRHTVKVKQFRIVVLGWGFGLTLLLGVRRDAMQQVLLCFGLTCLVPVAMKHFFYQIPEIQSRDTVNPQSCVKRYDFGFR